jgi:hypothetical protein
MLNYYFSMLKYYFRFFSPRPKLRRRHSLARQAAYTKHQAAARSLINSRLAHFNSFYGFSYGRVSIRDQKTRWGSCSRQGNLNFNYRLLHLRTELCDYVIVHELCHLQELNHGRGFWELVRKVIPNHQELRRELKQIRLV